MAEQSQSAIPTEIIRSTDRAGVVLARSATWRRSRFAASKRTPGRTSSPSGRCSSRCSRASGLSAETRRPRPCRRSCGMSRRRCRPRRHASPALERIARRCLEKDPEARFQLARDLAFALEVVAETPAPRAAPRARPGRRPAAEGRSRSSSSRTSPPTPRTRTSGWGSPTRRSPSSPWSSPSSCGRRPRSSATGTGRSARRRRGASSAWTPSWTGASSARARGCESPFS
jgi:serine/threonine protein kinase